MRRFAYLEQLPPKASVRISGLSVYARPLFVAGGHERQNRIILGADGDFNVGISNTDELVKFIEEKRDNHGNGNYEYIDNAKQIKKVFIYEKSKFYTIAQDGKVQITIYVHIFSLKLNTNENAGQDKKNSLSKFTAVKFAFFDNLP